MVGYIYTITNPKGKVYIGQTVNPIKRKSKYKTLDCKGQVKIYNSIRKYGWDNHKFEIIQTLNDCTNEELNTLEIAFIKEYNSLRDGLNLHTGGLGTRGLVWSQESRNRMSLLKTGSKMPPRGPISLDTRTKISVALKDKKRSKEAIAKSAMGKSKSVICIETGIIYKSAKEAEITLGLGHNVNSVCKGLRKTAGKLHFKYYNNDDLPTRH